MTPQERKLVEDLFARLATLERNRREPEAEQLIRDGLRKAPNATYALVQTVLLQDEALRQANERIQELETGEAPRQQESGGFLGSMREAVFGGGDRPRGAVPPAGGDRPMGVPPGFQRPGDPYQAQAQQAQAGGAPYPQQQEPARGGFGGSFLGTAAATAAGVIGGAMLMNSLKGAFGGDQAKAQGLGDVGGQQAANPSSNPWGGDAASGGALAQQAGLDSIGRPGGESERAGFHGQQPYEPMDEGATLPEDGDGFDMDFDTDFI
jgi:hypothetical protein